MVTNFTKLNQYVQRPVHPFPTAQDIIKRNPCGTKYFCKMDAVQGYHQIPLAEESRALTTFLLPSGCYRYKRGPMGLCCTSDNWCYKSDKAIAVIPHAFKIVDDILVVGRSVDKLMNQIDDVMRRCKQHGIALSRKKFTINNYVRFAGYWISIDGVEPEKHMTDP